MYILFNHFLLIIYHISYLICYFILHLVLGVLRGIACLQADLKCQRNDRKTIRREIVAIRKMVAAGPAAHEEVALKLNMTLPVTSQDEKCNGMLKNYI